MRRDKLPLKNYVLSEQARVAIARYCFSLANFRLNDEPLTIPCRKLEAFFCLLLKESPLHNFFLLRAAVPAEPRHKLYLLTTLPSLSGNKASAPFLVLRVVNLRFHPIDHPPEHPRRLPRSHTCSLLDFLYPRLGLAYPSMK